MSRILIVEPIPVLREHAARLVRETVPNLTPSEIATVSDCQSALEICMKSAPLMVIIDLFVLDVSGIRFAQRVWSISRTTKVLFWCSKLRASLNREIGAVVKDHSLFGYVGKAEGDQKFRYAIESLFLRDNPYFDPKARLCHASTEEPLVNSGEYEALSDVVLGLTDRAIARRRGLTVRGVQNRLATLSNKLLKHEHSRLREVFDMEVYNPRTRLIFEAIRRDVVSTEEVMEQDSEFEIWLQQHMSRPLVDQSRRRKRTEPDTISFAPDSVAEPVPDPVPIPMPQSAPTVI